MSTTSCTATWEPKIWRWVRVVVSTCCDVFVEIATALDWDPAIIEQIGPAPKRPKQRYRCPAYERHPIAAMPREWWRVVPRRRQFNHAQRARQLRRRFVQGLRAAT